ncbi:UDP-N-acetylglucosamine diphosphorylase/glucosamine-1-phosphate N-acetyltransferase [Wenyingzhuangia heitensis]|uniref:UDP-N-acetylglucosamine diphosphorylase/glucosamine-1-phosphate N-acetyltransferase n=1 Tax=Wenyingzhuangia heitensis TaxID=1487859 RepID=A0ABX0UH87_9FLAO|nr:GlmU family protein [Wenyingzhuangia heitensis]NIJ46382.1 UDP-N-acetylglucosamine diphosphorylase/glucosamine-1-phosphate N-acetyltransferase [Wenyingzhuangia heitensis]
MNYILFDGAFRDALLPFTFTRPVADIRIGILTIREKWERFLRLTTTTLTEDYLENKYPMLEMEENIFINAGYLPNMEFFKAVKSLKQNQAVFCNDEMIAFYSTRDQEEIDFSTYEVIEIEGVKAIEHKWDLFLLNDLAIRQDFEMLTADEISADIPEFVQAINKENIFIEEGAVINPCVLNASSGPIYIAKDAVVLDGALIRGPFALGEKALVKMGAKIYGATTVGPNCKVGGEIKNSILFANSNKGHEGYLGNSIIGEWCNFGADSNVSNLKNTYSKVRLWSYEDEIYEDSNQLLCGLMMGDHSKTSINTMFNTGTVVGVSANIFGSDLPEKFIPSFSWSGNKIIDVYTFKKAIRTATKMMELSNVEISEQDISILEHVNTLTEKYRKK